MALMYFLLAFASIAEAAVSLPMSKDVAPSVDKRGVASRLQGNGIAYLVSFELGGQTINAQLDTSTSDIVVVARSACPYNSGAGCDTPYDEAKSAHYQTNYTQFAATWFDDSTASGVYASDDLKIGGQNVANVNFALAKNATTANIFGIGSKYGEMCARWKPSRNGEVIDTTTGCAPYNNLPAQMKAQGLIQSSAYSIWVSKSAKESGQLLFGGVNTGAIVGDFYKVPLEKFAVGGEKFSEVTLPTILLNGVDLALNGNSTNLYKGAAPAVLDYGSTYSSFPSSVANALAHALNADSSFNVPANATYNGSLNLNFRGVELRIPLDNFVQDLYNGPGSPSGGRALGMYEDDESKMIVLGDNVLSSLYVTIDYKNNEVGLGQAAAAPVDHLVDIKGELDAKRAPLYDQKFNPQ